MAPATAVALGADIWGVYIALAVGFSAVAILMAWQGVGQSDTAGVIIGFVASIGLLLLSVSAATSLAEERAMGSLDVLLATPLPTSAIVWGKWWGTYRTVPLLAILPGIVAFALASQTGRWLGPPLVVGLMLAYGAAVTSLGLALATWVGRLSMALALCVGAVVGVTIGAIPVAMILFRNSNELGPWAAMASPFFFGVGYFSAMNRRNTALTVFHRPLFRPYSGAVFYAAAAGGLLAATLLTFEPLPGPGSRRSGTAPAQAAGQDAPDNRPRSWPRSFDTSQNCRRRPGTSPESARISQNQPKKVGSSPLIPE